MGIPWGAEATTEAMVAMRNHLPAGANWAGFAIGRLQMAFVAQALLLGGHVRIGLEDNIWLDRGVPASNGSLTTRARDRRADGREVSRPRGSPRQARPRPAEMTAPSEAGRVVAALEGVPFAGWNAARPIPAPLALHACVVKPEWTDYNGYMRESANLLVFGDNSDAFFRFFGVDEAYRAGGRSL
jgi:hypothetical protein